MSCHVAVTILGSDRQPRQCAWAWKACVQPARWSCRQAPAGRCRRIDALGSSRSSPRRTDPSLLPARLPQQRLCQQSRFLSGAVEVDADYDRRLVRARPAHGVQHNCFTPSRPSDGRSMAMMAHVLTAKPLRRWKSASADPRYDLHNRSWRRIIAVFTRSKGSRDHDLRRKPSV